MKYLNQPFWTLCLQAAGLQRHRSVAEVQRKAGTRAAKKSKAQSPNSKFPTPNPQFFKGSVRTSFPTQPTTCQVFPLFEHYLYFFV